VDPPATIGGGAQTGGDAMGGDGGVLSSDPLSAQSSRSLSAAHVTPCDLFFSRACGAVGPRWTARIKRGFYLYAIKKYGTDLCATKKVFRTCVLST
jgi:hypothetical protein